MGFPHTDAKLRRWRYEASTNLNVCQLLLPTTSSNFTFRCKSHKCPTSKIREFRKATFTYKIDKPSQSKFFFYYFSFFYKLKGIAATGTLQFESRQSVSTFERSIYHTQAGFEPTEAE